MNKLNFVLTLTMLIITSLSLSAFNVPPVVEKKSTVEGITEYQLKNGLKVLLFPDGSKPTITVNVTYLVGSRHEGYGETGMAHLLEHMVFKGTPKHPNIPQELTEHGTSPNGTTWYDRTNYFESFKATDENLEWALDLEADRMINSFIAKEDLESEMTVVRNEFESGENDPTSILMERVLSTSYLWHNYGKSTIGARSDIENVPIERLQAFYKKYYQPDNAVLLVVGKIDEEKTLKLIDKYFSPIPRPDRTIDPLFNTYTKEPTQDGERFVELERVGDVQVVSCAYHTAPGAHADFAAMQVLKDILTSEPSGRLYKSLVETKKASYQWGFAPGLMEGSFLYLNAEVRKENDLMDAKQTMMKTLDEMKDNPPTPEEVERAKSKILKNWDLNFNNVNRIGIFLSGYVAQGDWRLLFLYRDNIEKVTAEDVARVAGHYLKPSNRTVGLFKPTDVPARAEIPDAPQLSALVDNYVGKAAVAQGEVFDASPANIDKRSEKKVQNAEPDYIFLQKENRGDAVVARMTLRFGQLNDFKGKSEIADLTSSMLDRGTKNRTRQEIKDELDKLKARVRITGSMNRVSVRMETTNQNLPALIALVAEILKEPTFPTEEFEKLKEEDLSYLESQLSEPRTLANNLFRRSLNNYSKDDPRYVKPLEEQIASIKEVKIEEIREFYESFYGASDATISVVGDFDKARIEGLLERNFADWKSPKPFKSIKNEFKEIAAKDEKINTPDKANAMFLVGQKIKMNQSHKDYAALTLGNFMIGGGFLNSRLATRIRQEEGLSYGVGSWFSADVEDQVATFGSYAIYAPENLSKLEKAYKEEIAKVLKEGFTAEEIAAAKSGWLQRNALRRAEDARLVGTLNNNLYYGRDMMWYQHLEDKINALSADDILKALNRHIDPSKFVYIKAGDFEKVEKMGKP